MIDNSKQITLTAPFSKGFVDTTSDTSIKESFGLVTENLRILDGSLVPRKGFTAIKNFEIDGGICAIQESGSQLVVVCRNRKVYLSTDANHTTFDRIGNLEGATWIEDCSITSFGDYIMFWYGTTHPKVYDRKLFTFTDIPGGFSSDVAEIFTNRQWVANNDTTTGTFGVYGSTPVGGLIKTGVSTDYTTSDIYEFTDDSNLGVQEFESRIIGFASTLQRMYVFCEKAIYEFSSDYSNNASGDPDPRGPIFKKIYDGVGPINKNTIITVNDKVFFLGADKQFKTISYPAGLPLSVVGELSEGDYNLQYFLARTLNDDQTKAFGYLYGPERLIKFHIRSVTSEVNDLVLNFDIDAKSWLLDKGKSFTTGDTVFGKAYVGSSSSTYLYQDEVGKTDNGVAISIKRRSKRFNFGSETRKILREFILSGKINLTTNLTLNIYSNEELVKQVVLNKSIVSNPEAGIKTIDKLYNFRKVISKGDLFERGYDFEFEIVSTGTTLDFVLSGVSMKVVGIAEDSSVALTEK